MALDSARSVYHSGGVADRKRVRTPSSKRVSAMADALWKERNVLEALLFRLVEANVILVGEETRFVPQALAEVEVAAARLRGAETRRRRVAEAVAGDLGIAPGDLTLDYLAKHVPERVRCVFEEHRDGLHGLAAEIERVAGENRRLAARAVRHINERIGVLLVGATAPANPAGHGTAVGVDEIPVQVDEAR